MAVGQYREYITSIELTVRTILTYREHSQTHHLRQAASTYAAAGGLFICFICRARFAMSCTLAVYICYRIWRK